MSDRMYPLGIKKLWQLIVHELEKKNSILGIDKSLFFTPAKHSILGMKRYDHYLETPIGVAAGPHTQMAQNIITAWLTGSRYIELKTIQTLDELTIPRPCIDMEDEGYNCEWSQELKLDQSFNEYLKAFIIIHLLKHYLNYPLQNDLGCIFNMSAGYNMEGILNPNVQEFFKKMQNCQGPKEEYLNGLKKLYPQLADINIPNCISNNITLSTMHGCPSEEIEKIASYLINDLGLHTTVKLNPTLNGKDELRYILNNHLGYKKIVVPDIAFEHDLKYSEAKTIIKNLMILAQKKGADFSIKLTNTLECINHKEYFDQEKSPHMYMSGRPLHVLAINLACKLQQDFRGGLDLSFSAGVDALNVVDVLAANIKPVTVCSDLLKPGGYGRTYQYIEKIHQGMKQVKAQSIEDLVIKRSGEEDLKKATLINLMTYRDKIMHDERYAKVSFPYKNIKGNRSLTMVDCIKAPCMENCKASQNVPEYMRSVVSERLEDGLIEILKTNPMPNTTGMACDHKCENRCTRMNYDNPLHIREIKRFIAGEEKKIIPPKKRTKHLPKVAVIGAGPCGLSAAYYLSTLGFHVEIFEAKDIPGGMVTNILPDFRTIKEKVEWDIEKIKQLGVLIHTNTPIKSDNALNELITDFKYVIFSQGAPLPKKMGIIGEDHPGVIDFLSFLENVKKGLIKSFPEKVVIIGGGNSAIDAARTAKRLMKPGLLPVLVYRRMLEDMPADREEILELIKEKIQIMELVAPVAIKSDSGEKEVFNLECIKMKVNGLDQEGRNKVEKLKGSEFYLPVNLVISAIGQEYFKGEEFKTLKKEKTGEIQFCKDNLETSISNVFIGGDSARGPESIIGAIADGRKIVKEICYRENVTYEDNVVSSPENISTIRKKRVLKIMGKSPQMLPLEKRSGFDMVISAYTKEEARGEAKRCLDCDQLCEVCVTVCPNRANISYTIRPKEYHLKDIIIEQLNHSLGIDYIFSINQKYQVLNIGDWCNECGNCAIFCPTSGRPYQDKPKIYLSRKSFSEAGANAFYLEKRRRAKVLYAKTQWENYKLVYPKTGDVFYLENSTIMMQVRKQDIKVLKVDLIKRNGHVNMLEVAFMKELIEAWDQCYLGY